jgi:molybdopterin-synthase adenylyltransferase
LTEKKYKLNITADQVFHVKHSHLAVTNESGDLLFPFSPGGMIGARYERIRYQILALMDGKRTVRDIHESLKEKGYNDCLEDVLNSISLLAGEKLLEFRDCRLEGDETRYDRQRLFMGSFAEDGRNFSADIQKKLGSARVAVIGIGGIGSYALLSLLTMGLGNLVIVDCDMVALSNLNRQFFYSEEDLGKNKIDVLREKCPAYNSSLQYVFLHQNLQSAEDFISVINGCDLVIMTADTPRDKIFLWSHEAATATATPVLYTQGILLDSIAVGPLFIPGKTNCFHCFYPYTSFSYASLKFQHINQSYQHGSCMPHVAIAGQIMALEAVKHLTGFHQCRLYNHIVRINLDTYELEYKQGPSAQCQWCDSSLKENIRHTKTVEKGI